MPPSRNLRCLRRALGRQSRHPSRSRRPRRSAGVRRRSCGPRAARRSRRPVALSRRSRLGGCQAAAARRGRAAPGAAAAGRRCQEISRMPELILKRLARAVTARGFVADQKRVVDLKSVSVSCPAYQPPSAAAVQKAASNNSGCCTGAVACGGACPLDLPAPHVRRMLVTRASALARQAGRQLASLNIQTASITALTTTTARYYLSTTAEAAWGAQASRARRHAAALPVERKELERERERERERGQHGAEPAAHGCWSAQLRPATHSSWRDCSARGAM